MSRRRRLPPEPKHLGLRRRLRQGPPPDPDRRKRELPPTACLEEHIEDLVAWMIAGGFSAEAAQEQGEWIRQFHRDTGVNFLTLPVADQFAFLDECNRRIDALAAEELGHVDPEERGH